MIKSDTFGSHLKYHRRQSTDPHKGGTITQERLSELLEESGISITAKTLSNWERGYSHPRRSQRDIVLSLIQQLKQNHGLQTIVEANQLLQSGNYRPLTPSEQNQIDNAWANTATSTPATEQNGSAAIKFPTIIPHPSPLPIGSRLFIQPNSFFRGREQALIFLTQQFTEPVTYPPSTIAITGLGGIGKTQLAAEFAHRYGRYFAGGIFWINFDQPETITAQIAECGDVGYLDLSSNFDDLPLPKQVALVKQAWQQSQPRLLIFDGCEEEQLLSQWRPVTGGCRVLITSQQQQWHPTLCVRQLPLDVLPHNESIALLRQFHPSLSQEEADSIAKLLGDFPLALHLAGSYLANYHYDIQPKQYLAQLYHWHKQKQSLHPSLTTSPIHFSPTNHRSDILATFTLIYQQLVPTDSIDKLAQTLLAHIVCFVANEPIPRTLLQATITAKTVQFAQAIRRLLNLGLITVTNNGDIYSHKLLTTFIKSVIPFVEVQRVVKTAVLPHLVQLNEDHNIPLLRTWHVHIQYLIDTNIGGHPKLTTQLYYEFSRYLYRRGDYLVAEHYGQQALKQHQQIHDLDQTDKALIHTILGKINRELVNYEIAKYHQHQALSIHEQHGDPANSGIIKNLVSLASLYRAMGAYTEAQSYLDQLLQIQANATNMPPLDKAIILTSVGSLMQETGIFIKARQCFQQVVTIRRQNLPENHPLIAHSLNNLGFCLQRMGHYHEALSCQEEALAIRQQTLGNHHPLIGNTFDKLGKLHQCLGRYTEARPLIEQGLTVRVNSLGAEQAITALSYNNLGELLIYLEEHELAQDYLEKALTTHTKIVGRNHVMTTFSLNNLGVLFKVLGDYEMAQSYLQEAAEIRQQTLGPHHLLTSYPLHELGDLYLKGGQWEQAHTYFQQALEIRQTVVGESSPITARTLFYLGILVHNQGNDEKAYTLLQRAYTIQQERLGATHPNTAVTRTYLNEHFGCRAL